MAMNCIMSNSYVRNQPKSSVYLPSNMLNVSLRPTYHRILLASKNFLNRKNSITVSLNVEFNEFFLLKNLHFSIDLSSISTQFKFDKEARVHPIFVIIHRYYNHFWSHWCSVLIVHIYCYLYTIVFFWYFDFMGQ